MLTYPKIVTYNSYGSLKAKTSEIVVRTVNLAEVANAVKTTTKTQVANIK